MEFTNQFIAVIAALGIPTATTGFLVWWLQHRITRHDALRDKEQLQIQQTLKERAKLAHARAQI